MTSHSLVRRVLLGFAAAALGCSSATPDGAPDAGTEFLDAGVDAGAGDAGTQTLDAGIDGGEGDAGTPSPSPAEFYEGYKQAVCAAILTCNQPIDAHDAYGCREGAFALSDRPGFGSIDAIRRSIDSGKVRYDAAQARACLAAIPLLACSEVSADLTMRAFVRTAPGCEDVFTGTVPEHETCNSEPACASGLFCLRDYSKTCEGTCERVGVACEHRSWTERRNAGECDADKRCVDDRCVPWTNPPGKLDEPCGDESACEAGLTCRFLSGSSGPSTCQSNAVVGAACGSHEHCAAGLFCHQGACTTRPPIANEGDSCETANCAAGLACVYDTDDGARCLVPRTLGESCTRLFECGANLACDVDGIHTCVARPTTGPCLVVGQFRLCDARTTYCDEAATCRPYKAAGEACSYRQCGPGPLDSCEYDSDRQGDFCSAEVVCLP